MKAVMCVETGKTYQSINEAAQMTNCCVKSIRRSCRNPKHRSSGYNWIYLTGRPILQLDLDGNIINKFESIKKAYKSIGSKNVLHVLQGKRKTCKGYLWKYT